MDKFQTFMLIAAAAFLGAFLYVMNSFGGNSQLISAPYSSPTATPKIELQK
ncbi:MAG: hypothetical protein ACHQUA_00600 [Microgenomates group bacterium]